MELNISGLKCDHCDYRDDEVQFSEYESSIGKPCPKCGESLLTQKEYDYCLKMYEIVNIIDIFKWFNPFYYLSLLSGKSKNKVIYKHKFPNRKTK